MVSNNINSLQILEAENYETVEEREKELLNKLGDVLTLEDFCYLNVLMRVRFPLSDAYSSDTDWRRHTKTIEIFEMILKQAMSLFYLLNKRFTAHYFKIAFM